MAKGKGKYNIFRIIFSRKMLSALILMLQLAVFAVAFTFLREKAVYIYTACMILAIILAIFEINRDENPEFKLTWVLLIGLIPIFGAILYLYLHLGVVTRSIRKKLVAIQKSAQKYMHWDDDGKQTLKAYAKNDYGIFGYLYDYCGFPAHEADEIKYFGMGEDFFDGLVESLKKAEKFIFIEMFIIREGRMWNTILDILTEKAKSGVKVRLMYDGMGCMTLLPSDYPKKLAKLGIKCAVFSPIRPFLSTYQNNRDHRKLIVIDGKTAFAGGVNFGDEYINEIVRFGKWKDAGVRFTGGAVNSVCVMFMEMWEAAAKESLNYSDYLVKPNDSAGIKGYITPYYDSPVDNEATGERVYIDMLNTAEKYVHIMTP